jgi:glycosyltransferase involved in cell wall biosynthesis
VVIMHVVAPAAFGGLERIVQLLAEGVQGRGHDVHVVACVNDAAGAEPFVATLSKSGVQVHPVVVSPRGYGRERAAIAELCRRLRPDAVHTHGYRPDVVDAGVVRHLGIPLVATAHGFTGGPLRNRAYEYLQRRAFRRFDAVIAVSRPLGDRLARSGVPRSQLHVVPNAWQRSAEPLERAAARRALGLEQEAIVLGWVGRLSEEKGPDVLIESLRHVKDIPITVSIIGDGPRQRSLRVQAERLGVSDQIRWHGVVPNAERVFAAFDLFVLSSRTEGTPVVLFEAMAAGVPVVSTAVGGIPDVVSAEEALLVRSEDPRALAAAMRDVYGRPSAAAQRTRAARLRLDRDHGIEPWLDRYMAIYRVVASGASTRAVA